MDAHRRAVVVVLEVAAGGAAAVVMVAVGAVAARPGHGPLHAVDRGLAETSIHASLTSVPAVTIKPLQP